MRGMPQDARSWHRFSTSARWKHALPRAVLLMMVLGFPLTLCAASAGGARFPWLLWLAVFPLLMLMAGPAYAILTATADILDTGTELHFHLIGPWRIVIPWEALQFSAVLDVRTPLVMRLLLPREAGPLHAVHTPGITRLKPVGVYFGLGIMPVFILTPEHNSADNLIKRLRHHQHPLTRARQKKTSLWRNPDRGP